MSECVCVGRGWLLLVTVSEDDFFGKARGFSAPRHHSSRGLLTVEGTIDHFRIPLFIPLSRFSPFNHKTVNNAPVFPHSLRLYQT